MDCKHSSLCIFDKQSVQTDIQRNNVVDYYPVSSLSSGGPIEFHIPGSSEEYIDLNDTTVYLKLRIIRGDGKAIDATDRVALNNLPISTLFQDVALTVGETQIEGGQMSYPYLGYFNTVSQFHPSAQKSHMQMFGWYKDQAGHFDDEKNSGFIARKALINGSNIVEFEGPLFLDFFRQDRHLISQTDIRLKLTPSKPEFALNAFGGNTSFKIDFQEVILYVHRVEMNPSVINGHAAGLKKQNAIYPVLHSEIITFTIPKGQKSYTKDRLFPDQAPKMLMVAMVENEAFNGHIKKNPFNFHHFDLNKLALYNEGRSVPGRPFEPDYDEKMYLRVYKNTMRALGYYNSDDTNGLTISEFANGYNIYAFDLTPEKNVSATYRQGYVNKNLRLELFFKKDLPSTINVLLYAVFDSQVEITQLRDVITHYTR